MDYSSSQVWHDDPAHWCEIASVTRPWEAPYKVYLSKFLILILTGDFGLRGAILMATKNNQISYLGRHG